VRIVRVIVAGPPYPFRAPLIVSKRTAYFILVIPVVHQNTLIVLPFIKSDISIYAP